MQKTTLEINREIIELLSKCVERNPCMTFQWILRDADITDGSWDTRITESSAKTLRKFDTAIDLGYIHI